MLAHFRPGSDNEKKQNIGLKAETREVVMCSRFLAAAFASIRIDSCYETMSDMVLNSTYNHLANPAFHEALDHH